jgi:predicted transcriptional regulator
MVRTNVKADARRLIDELPGDATWEDLMYRIYVRQAIEAGLDDVAAGRTLDIKEVRARFGLST